MYGIEVAFLISFPRRPLGCCRIFLFLDWAGDDGWARATFGRLVRVVVGFARKRSPRGFVGRNRPSAFGGRMKSRDVS